MLTNFVHEWKDWHSYNVLYIHGYARLILKNDVHNYVKLSLLCTCIRESFNYKI